MSKRFQIEEAPLSGLYVLTRTPLQDNRGSFERLFCADELKEASVNDPIVQINQSVTKAKGTVRGLHFQHPPHSEMKLVSCLQGRILDVAVDLRRNSPSFLQSYGTELSADNSKTLVIPQGFAHGFQTLTDDCAVLYCHTAFYDASYEDGINPLDPTLSVKWLLPVTNLSERDANLPFVTSQFEGLPL